MARLGMLGAIGLVALLGLGAIGLVDYDEAAYGEVARAMLRSGDWLVPRLCGAEFFEKPPLLYWTAAAGMELLGVGPAGVRLGTALAGLAAPLVLFGFARQPLGERAAFAAALVLASSLEFAVLARIAFTDMLLSLWLVLCMGALHRAFEGGERATRWFAAACVASALAVLTKGAIGVLLPGSAGLGELALRRRLRDALRPSWLAIGVAIVIGLGFSWYLALGLTRPEGFAFMRSLFLEHHVGRFSRPMQGHGGSIFYYLPVLAVGMFPWSPLLPLALARLRLREEGERARFLRLFALFSALTFVFFSAAATKLANYVAPVLPGLALAIGALAAEPAGAASRGLALSRAAALGFALLAAAALCALPLLVGQLPALLGSHAELRPLSAPLELGAGGLVAALALAAGALAAGLAWRGGQGERATALLSCAAVGAYTVLFQTVAVRADAQLSEPLRRLAVHAAALSAPDERLLLLGLRHRPSVCFYAERPTRFATASGARWAEKDIFGPAAPRLGLTGEPQLARFPDRDRLQVIERDGGYVLFRSGSGAAGD
ncbi:MAG TPA: glycosyltransferase family 39 protein [Myxococcota bacterium]|nr:glycosyltransferase family 39 protein [Myxococcota bacterium]